MLTLAYFSAWSNFVTWAFPKEKVKIVEISETIAASDLKVGRSRHLIEYMKYVSIEGQGPYLTLAQGRVHTKIQTIFSKKNYGADLNHILYTSFQAQGNENLMTCCWYMTKMAATPTYGKNQSKIFFSEIGRPISTKLGM